MGQKLTRSNTSNAKHLVLKKEKKSSYNSDETKLNDLTHSLSLQMEFIERLIIRKNDTLILSHWSAQTILQRCIDSLNKVEDTLEAKKVAVEFNFIRNNPSSFVSLDRLYLRLARSEGDYVTFKSLFSKLDKNLQVSPEGRRLKLTLLNMVKSSVGNKAPDFTIKDIRDTLISLSSFLNKKYVLLDFWASWCKPCREDMPFLKKIYNVYREKGLEIIGISKDDDFSALKKAVQTDSTQNWRQISVPLNVQDKDGSAITNKYFVYGIPVKILINKDGVIIGRWTGGGEENMVELKKLLNKALYKL